MTDRGAPISPAYLRPAAVMAELGIGRETFWRLIRSGELASFKPSPRIRLVPRESLDAFVADRLAAERGR
jgi:excisionase family DNA binding protein